LACEVEKGWKMGGFDGKEVGKWMKNGKTKKSGKRVGMAILVHFNERISAITSMAKNEICCCYEAI
jgi:hypothetical protein